MRIIRPGRHDDEGSAPMGLSRLEQQALEAQIDQTAALLRIATALEGLLELGNWAVDNLVLSDEEEGAEDG